MNILKNEKTFELSRSGWQAAKQYKFWYQRKLTYTVILLLISTGAITAISLTTALNATVASMGTVEQAAKVAFKLKLSGL